MQPESPPDMRLPQKLLDLDLLCSALRKTSPSISMLCAGGRIEIGRLVNDAADQIELLNTRSSYWFRSYCFEKVWACRWRMLAIVCVVYSIAVTAALVLTQIR